MPLPEENQLPELNPSFGEESEQKQRRQMLIALGSSAHCLNPGFDQRPRILVSASTASRIRVGANRTDRARSADTPANTPASSSTTKPSSSEHARSKSRTRLRRSLQAPAPALAPVVTSRTVLPPLEVEVVAGDEHRTIQAGTNSVKVDLQPRTPVTCTQSASDTGGVADATGRVHLSPGAAQIISRPVEPNYPLLAKQMKVQGAVVLEALIGRDGNIQDLHILSGPTILSAAAREAVKQWRFKPYLQSGEAVETEARITVNFTISTQ